jgi:hypothetical protein
VPGIMEPTETGHRYDKIATWRNYERLGSTTGLVGYVRRATGLASGKRRALNVCCGSRLGLLDALERLGFDVTGADVSLGIWSGLRERTIPARFVLADICRWQPPREYDVVVAWDSTFHVPPHATRDHREALRGTGGRGRGAVHRRRNRRRDHRADGGQELYYSSLDDGTYPAAVKEAGCRCVLLERDAFREDHVVFIGVKGGRRRSEP